MQIPEFTPVLTKHGKPGWRTADGRIIPVVAGAAVTPPTEEHEPQDPNQPPPVAPGAPAPQDDGLRIPAPQQVPPQDQPPMDPDRVFTAADIEKARQEEKDKLYSRLQAHDEEIQRLRQEREERERQEAERQREIEEAERRAREEEMSVRELLQQKEQEWEARFEEERKRREDAEAVFEMERKLQAVDAYASRRLQEEEDEIMPELRDLVGGNTEEEVEQSIAFAKDRTARILGSVAAVTQQQRQAQPGTRVTSPPVGPMENDSSYQTVTPDDVRNMDMETYRQNREQLLAAARNKVQNTGLYGQ